MISRRRTFDEAFTALARLQRIEHAAREFITADERFFVDGDDAPRRLRELNEAKRRLSAAVRKTRGGT
jgi:hypothetical protein